MYIVGGACQVYSVLEVSMVVRRLGTFWVLNIIVPMTLFSLISFTAFAIDSDELGDRSSVTLTILLTNVAYKYMIADKLPSVNYLTLLDQYTYFSFIFLFIVVGENWLVTVSSWANENEYKFWILVMSLWAGISLAYFWQMLRTRNKHIQVMDSLSPEPNVIWIGPLATDHEWTCLALEKAVRVELMKHDIQAVRMVFWNGIEATEYCDEIGIPTYTGKSRFGVVQLQDADAAQDASVLLDMETVPFAAISEGQRNRRLLSAELLKPEWHVLLAKPGDTDSQEFIEAHRIVQNWLNVS